jgi:hypothetical protein
MYCGTAADIRRLAAAHSVIICRVVATIVAAACQAVNGKYLAVLHSAECHSAGGVSFVLQFSVSVQRTSASCCANNATATSAAGLTDNRCQ